jgi:hypothetical protein
VPKAYLEAAATEKAKQGEHKDDDQDDPEDAHVLLCDRCLYNERARDLVTPSWLTTVVSQLSSVPQTVFGAEPFATGCLWGAKTRSPYL